MEVLLFSAFVRISLYDVNFSIMYGTCLSSSYNIYTKLENF